MICRQCRINTTPSHRLSLCRDCDSRPLCRDCGRVPANRARGLCNRCYLDAPRVRPRAPEADVMGRRPLPRTPTAYAPGTVEKLDVLAERAERRESLHHPCDADHGGAGRRIEMRPRGKAAKLSAEAKAAIVQGRAEGVRAVVLAERYGVLPQTIYDVASRYQEVVS